MKLESFKIRGHRIYDCDIESSFEYEKVTTEDLPFKYIQKLQKLGLNPIRVPIRQNGLSSKGSYRQCHVNVKRMCERYGGSMIQGQEILFNEHPEGLLEDHLICNSHSVWLTPENKITCITKSNQRRSSNPDKEYILFIPRVVCDHTKNQYITHYDFMLTPDDILSLFTCGEPLLKRDEDVTKQLQGVNLRSKKYVSTKGDVGVMRKMLDVIRKESISDMDKSCSFLRRKTLYTRWTVFQFWIRDILGYDLGIKINL